ncbi:hypothetical protein F4781DRAFT_443646 [Annulohypoxylon bovei var. microspora]|nr:hypothetical protein F4781DRAFT_443646 [Annulohypoxylon bovei var. microspora]
MFRNEARIPSAFRCSADGEWLTPDHFSQRQIVKWLKQKDINDSLTPETIGLLCKEHNEQHQNQMGNRELHCNGPCGAWKPRDHFSKNQRNIDNPWCSSCTFWATTVGAKEIPGPPPGAEIRSQETITHASSVRHRVPDDQVSRTEINDTVTRTTTTRSIVTHTTTDQSSRVISDQQHSNNDMNVNHSLPGISMSIIRDAPIPEGPRAMFVHKQTSDGISAENFTDHSTLKEDLVRGSASRHTFTDPPNLRGGTTSVESGEPHLYNRNPFAPSAHPAEKSVTGTSSEESKAPAVPGRPVEASRGKWAKVDSRKIFYAKTDYAAQPAVPEDTRDPDWDSDDEIEF